jgi:chromosome segregation ATPase
MPLAKPKDVAGLKAELTTLYSELTESNRHIAELLQSTQLTTCERLEKIENDVGILKERATTTEVRVSDVQSKLSDMHNVMHNVVTEVSGKPYRHSLAGRVEELERAENTESTTQAQWRMHWSLILTGIFYPLIVATVAAWAVSYFGGD